MTLRRSEAPVGRESSGLHRPAHRTAVLLALVITSAQPARANAQTFQQGEQFGSLSCGYGSQSLFRPGFVWTSETFPDGLVLPPRQKGWALDISGGAMIRPRLAVVAGVEFLAGNLDVRLATFRVSAGLRGWLTNRLWVQGALGPAYLGVFAGRGDDQVTDGRWGLGATGILGFDLLQRRDSPFVAQGHSVLHLETRLGLAAGGGVRTNGIAGLLGFTTGW